MFFPCFHFFLYFSLLHFSNYSYTVFKINLQSLSIKVIFKSYVSLFPWWDSQTGASRGKCPWILGKCPLPSCTAQKHCLPLVLHCTVDSVCHCWLFSNKMNEISNLPHPSAPRSDMDRDGHPLQAYKRTTRTIIKPGHCKYFSGPRKCQPDHDTQQRHIRHSAYGQPPLSPVMRMSCFSVHWGISPERETKAVFPWFSFCCILSGPAFPLWFT